MDAAESPPNVPPPGEPARRVEVVFDVSEASQLADLIAREHAAPRPARPLASAAGAALGAALGGVAWYGLMHTAQSAWVAAAPALLVALLAAGGAVVLGGRGRASQVAATTAALLVVLVVRVAWLHVEVAAERTRLPALRDAPAELVALREQRLAARLRPAAVARRLLDPLGLAAYAVVLAIAWRLPQRTR
jgi:hypothetical protein